MIGGNNLRPSMHHSHAALQLRQRSSLINLSNNGQYPPTRNDKSRLHQRLFRPNTLSKLYLGLPHLCEHTRFPLRSPPALTATMAERSLSQILTQLKGNPSMSYPDANALLSKAKLALLNLKSLTPSPSVSQSVLALARETYEQGALFAIRARNPDAFTRYVQQLQPFYELPPNRLPVNVAERNKVTGLSLLLLLTQGKYAEFHSELESLANREGGGGDVEGDRYLGYPIRLERWLMEGSYDRVWKAMKSSEVPCDEYSVFSEVRTLSTPILAEQTTNNHAIDPQEPDPLRDRQQQRARLPQPTHQLHQVPSVPRLRGRRHLLRQAPRLDSP